MRNLAIWAYCGYWNSGRTVDDLTIFLSYYNHAYIILKCIKLIPPPWYIQRYQLPCFRCSPDQHVLPKIHNFHILRRLCDSFVRLKKNMLWMNWQWPRCITGHKPTSQSGRLWHQHVPWITPDFLSNRSSPTTQYWSPHQYDLSPAHWSTSRHPEGWCT